MRISNRTRGTVVAADAAEARSFAQRLFGLMGKPPLPTTGALVIYDTNWIHTFWMHFALDVIYINRQRCVVGIEEGLPPNRIGKPFWSAHSVIEMNAGAIHASQTQVGDELQWDQ